VLVEQLAALRATGSGRALSFLTPEESGFLHYLKAAEVALNE
jgi:hypothetical protein